MNLLFFILKTLFKRHLLFLNCKQPACCPAACLIIMDKIYTKGQINFLLGSPNHFGGTSFASVSTLGLLSALK